MPSRNYYSSITLTSLLDVVFITLFLVLLNLGSGYRSATNELAVQEQRNAAQVTEAFMDADATVQAANAAAASARADARSTFIALAGAATTIARSAQEVSAVAATRAALAEQGQLAARAAATEAAAAATRVAGAAATLRATATALAGSAQRSKEDADAAATYVSMVSASALAAQATASAAFATAEVRNSEAAQAEATVAAQQTTVAVAVVTAESMAQSAQQLYQEAQQIVAAETADPGITLAKAQWIDKYGNFYLIRLSPVVDGRSTVEVFRNDNFLSSSQVSTEAQIRDLLAVLDRGDVADTLVILKFSGASSDNHRQWILRYLDNYSFKYQRIQEGEE